MASSHAERMAEWRRKEHHEFRPATKMALKLWATGAVKTQKEAAQVTGACNPSYLSQIKGTVTGQKLVAEMEAGINERAMTLSAVIAKLSEKAVKKMEQLMEGSTEDIQFRAAKDILDRNPETSKLQKLQVESFTLSGRDAKGLADALAQGREAEARFAEVETGNFVKIEEHVERPGIVEAAVGSADDGKGNTSIGSTQGPITEEQPK